MTMKSAFKNLAQAWMIINVIDTAKTIYNQDDSIQKQKLEPLEPNKLERAKELAKKMEVTHDIRFGQTEEGSKASPGFFSKQAIVKINSRRSGFEICHELAHVKNNDLRNKTIVKVTTDLFLLGVSLRCSLSKIALATMSATFMKKSYSRHMENRADEMAIKHSSLKEIGQAIHAFNDESTLVESLFEFCINSDWKIVRKLGKIAFNKDGDLRLGVLFFNYNTHPKTSERTAKLIDAYYQKAKHDPIKIQVDNKESEISADLQTSIAIREMIQTSKKKKVLFDTSTIVFNSKQDEINAIFRRESDIELHYDVDNAKIKELKNSSENPSKILTNLVREALDNKPSIIFTSNSFNQLIPEWNNLEESVFHEKLKTELAKLQQYKNYDINKMKLYRNSSGSWECQIVEK